jgi:hypothetical protein
VKRTFRNLHYHQYNSDAVFHCVIVMAVKSMRLQLARHVAQIGKQECIQNFGRETFCEIEKVMER